MVYILQMGDELEKNTTYSKGDEMIANSPLKVSMSIKNMSYLTDLVIAIT